MTEEIVPLLEADPASLRAVVQDLRLDADAMAAAASSVNFDADCMAGSAVAAVLAQIRPVVSISVEAASTRLLQFADNVEQSAEGYERADVEFAEALRTASVGGDVRGQPN